VKDKNLHIIIENRRQSVINLDQPRDRLCQQKWRQISFVVETSDVARPLSYKTKTTYFSRPILVRSRPRPLFQDE